MSDAQAESTLRPSSPANRSFAPSDFLYFKINVEGLNGGHSGGDIHLGRANANKLLARFLFLLSGKHEVVLSEIDGGNLRNAIPRASHAVIGVHTSRKEDVRVALNHYIADLENEYQGIEPNLKITMESVDAPDFTIDQATSTNIIRALYCAPHGVVSMSRELEGLVETSTNLASVKMAPRQHYRCHHQPAQLCRIAQMGHRPSGRGRLPPPQAHMSNMVTAIPDGSPTLNHPS